MILLCSRGEHNQRDAHLYPLKVLGRVRSLDPMTGMPFSNMKEQYTMETMSMAKLTQGLINHWCGQAEIMAVLHKWSVWSWFELANKAACPEERETLDEASVVGLGSDGTQADHELFQTPDHQACGSSHDQVLRCQGSSGQNVQGAVPTNRKLDGDGEKVSSSVYPAYQLP